MHTQRRPSRPACTQRTPTTLLATAQTAWTHMQMAMRRTAWLHPTVSKPMASRWGNALTCLQSCMHLRLHTKKLTILVMQQQHQNILLHGTGNCPLPHRWMGLIHHCRAGSLDEDRTATIRLPAIRQSTRARRLATPVLSSIQPSRKRKIAGADMLAGIPADLPQHRAAMRLLRGRCQRHQLRRQR